MRKYMVVGLILVGWIQTFSQGTSNEILEKRISLVVSNMSLIYVLDRLSADYDVPIGLELAENEKFPRVVSFEISDGSLKDVLRILKTQVPEYSWEVLEGVVNFYPVKGRNRVLSDLLEERIAVLAIERGSSIFEIRDALFATSELKDLMISKKVRRSQFADSPSLSEPVLVEREYCFRGSTVRLILNRIVMDSKLKIWTLDLDNRNLKLILR